MQNLFTDPSFVSRSAALNRLREFEPNAGRAYANQRNHDYGPDERANVSMLSPYITHRLLSEPEVIHEVLQHHSPSAAEKFIQEVCWRTYWKGWLEMRPSVWTDYVESVRECHAAMNDSPPDADAYQAAIHGTTGIECFDHWANELTETGYLHNHARMWFASIWIFTLELPWPLGADFFYRNLLDGDSASNTLSWRWVAGLHTPGKHYVARASNIAKYTGGRFNPTGQLNENPQPLSEAFSHDRIPYDPGDSLPEAGSSIGLWLHPEDLSIEHSELASLPITTAAYFETLPDAGSKPFATHVECFKQRALHDATSRLSDTLGVKTDILPGIDPCEEFVSWAKRNQLTNVICSRPCIGHWQAQWDSLTEALQREGIHISSVRRRWDRDLHPHATAGYFKFKKQIPRIIKLVDQYLNNT